MEDRVQTEILSLRDSDPSGAVELLEKHNFQSDVNSRAFAAAIYIDCGEASSHEVWISSGIEILEAIVLDYPKSSEVRYNLANGFASRSRVSATDDASTDRFRARIEFGKVIEDQNSDWGLRSQAATNIGNLLVEDHRWVEAIDFYRRAQELMPTNSVALFREAETLSWLYNRIQDDFEKLQDYAHFVGLQQRIGELKHRALENLDVFSELAGPRARSHAEEILRSIPSHEPVAKRQRSSSYLSFIEEQEMALCVCCGEEDFTAEQVDLLKVRSVSETFENPEHKMPEIFAMLNIIKSDYSFAREIYFQRYSERGLKARSDYATYSETLDYAVYGTAYSALGSAQKMAVDILDKIAVAIAVYLGMKNARDVGFRDIWGKFQKGNQCPPCSEIKNQLENGNLGMLALKSLYEDFCQKPDLGDGFLKVLKALRHSATHRFTVLHDELLGISKHEKAVAEHWYLPEFEQATLSSLRVARAAIFYLVEAINFVESSKIDQPFSVSFEVPDYESFRKSSL